MKLAFNEGDRVHVVNMKLSGEVFVEGEAILVKKDYGQNWHLRFIDKETGEPEGPTYPRRIDPWAQADPEKYVKGLNDEKNSTKGRTT